MNDLRKAAGEALEALEDVPYMSNKDDYERLERVKTALRQALVDADDTSENHVDETVKSEHEPVAWISDSPTKGNGKQLHWAKAEAWRWSSNITPLYTAPPKRELTCVCGAVWEGEMMVHPPRKAAEWFDCTDAQLMDEVRRRGFVIRDAQIDPVKREWVGLTDEEIDSIDVVQMKYIGSGEYVIEGEYEFARAIEAKLKERNE